MGLLERALQYKQRINETGKETLIDKITGPAETELSKSNKIKKIDVKEFENNDENETQLEVFLDNDLSLKEIDEKEEKEEEIILFDEKKYFVNENKDKVSIVKTDANEIRSETEDVSDSVLETEKITETDSGKEYILSVPELKSETVMEGFEEAESNLENVDLQITEFNDYTALYEIQKEFMKADSIEEIYSTILFSILGQIGVSSVSIIAPLKEEPEKWVIIDSSGIKLSDDQVFWKIDSGIINILNIFKGLLDIEDLKNDGELRDDYYKFTAVDARLILPLLKDGKLAGAILVGEKINSEEFTETELDFLKELSETSSLVIGSISKYEKSNTELLAYRIEKEILSDVEIFQESLLNISSLNELKDVITKNFFSLGLECYSIFIHDSTGNDYIPVYYENDDFLGFSESGFKIKEENRLITFLINNKSSIILENFSESSVIIDTFGRERVSRMEYFIAYPFVISGKLSGFITIFKINPAVDIIDIDIRVQKINRFIFSYIYRIFELDPELNKYNDLTAKFYERIDREIKHASELNIPLSIVLISIKNYKRFHDRFGKIELEKLLTKSAEIIKSKLGEGDFSSRIEKNKFLLVLPGKEKRYSIIIANSIKNEIVERYNMTDFKLLITTLNAVFPDDGKDLFSILEVLE